MKRSRFLMIWLALSAAALAQQTQQQPATPQIARTNVTERPQVPTRNDMYCSGVVNPQSVSRDSYVAQGWDAPFQTLYTDNHYVYLTGGNYEKGARYQIVRAVRDINTYEMTKNQRGRLKAAGTPYDELGWVVVEDVQKGIGIARVEFNCDPIVPGDLAIPFTERPTPQFRRNVAFNFFAEPNGKATGRILGFKEFDVIQADRGKMYIDVGTDDGIKPGDYFRITRTYESMYNDPSDSLSRKASIVEPSQSNPQQFPARRVDDLPRKSLGEAMVLYATPKTATAIIVRSWEQLQVGDGVELMEELPPLPPPAPVAMNPPTITCTASPATIHVGESATVRCNAASPDEREVTVSFNTDNGQVVGRGPTATLDARNARPGVANVTATATDDRNISATAVTRIFVESAAAPEPATVGEFQFKPNSSYVDNLAKAMLDDIALRLEREPGSSVLFVGYTVEPEVPGMGLTRANNTKNYLVKDKGLDPGRIHTSEGGRGGRRIQMWWIPAGATMPTIPPATPPQQTEQPQQPPPQQQ